MDSNIVMLKYILITMVVYFMIKAGLNIELVIVGLLFIVANQIRNFIIKENKALIICTYIIEGLTAIYLLNNIDKYGFLVVLPMLIDIAIKYKKVVAIIVFIVLEGILVTSKSYEAVYQMFLCGLPIILLGNVINEESSSKFKAQKLYDKLRINEEKLKKANVELESYANTIEEIAILRERNRISREIHDNVGHALSTISIQLGAVEKVATKDGDLAANMANNLSEFTKESLQRVRTAVKQMKPREFEEYEGIIAITEMIKNFEKLSGIKVKLRVSDNRWKINSDQTMVIYRIVQEFLSNSIKHGKATEVKMFINFLEDSLRLQLKDNGEGSSNVVEGVGLTSIKERVQIWGGAIEYYTKKKEGFELVVTMDRGRLSIDGIE